MALPPINENGRAKKIPLPILNQAQLEDPQDPGVNRITNLSSLPYNVLALPLARDLFQVLSGKGFQYDDLAKDSDVYELERKIDYLTMDNKDKEAMPLALVLLALKVQNRDASQDYFIRVAGICLLGGRHDIYSRLVDLMYMPNDEKNIDVIKGFLQTLELPQPVEQPTVEPPPTRVTITLKPVLLPSADITGVDKIRLLESEINFFNMSGRHTETIPLVLDLLATQIECKSASQSNVIRAAGACNLGGRHDLYNELLKLMHNPNDEKNINIVKALLTPFKEAEQATLRND